MVICAHIVQLVRAAPALFPVQQPSLQPAARNDRVGLEQFQSGTGLHLGRNYAQKVVLLPDAVDGCYLAPFRDEFQASGKLEGALLLPVEIDAYDHVVEHERRLCENSRAGYGVEIQLVVEHPVIGNFPVAPADLLGAGPVGYDFEGNALRAQKTYAYLFFLSGQSPFYHLLFLFAYAHFAQHLFQKGGSGLLIVFFIYAHKDSRHIGGSRTDFQPIRPIAVIMAGALGASEHHKGSILSSLAIGVEVELGLALPFLPGGAVQKTIEELGHRLAGRSLQRKDSVDIVRVVVQCGILYAGKRLGRGIQKLVHSQLQG